MAITIAVNVTKTSGPSPLGVTFDASGTTSTATARPFFDCLYSWTFTPSANVVALTNKPAADMSVAYGPIVSRVFTGNVTADLTVTEPGGATAAWSQAITVAAETTY